MAKQPSPALTRFLLLIILLLAVGLRFHGLDAQSLWNDEGSSVALAGRDLATIARDAARDIHPPLYYWLLAGWTRLVGTSEVGVRALSAVLAVLLVALTYPLGRLLAGRWAGLAAALLAAINPFQVYYAQEARMYALLALLGAVAFYCALRWAAEPRPRWAVAYVLAAAAGLYTHYAFPLVLLALNLLLVPWTALGHPRRDMQGREWLWSWPLLRWLALNVVAALLFLPWLPAAYRQLTAWPGVEGSVDTWQALAEFARLFTTGPAASPWPETSVFLLFLLLIFVPGHRARRSLPPLVAYLAPVLWLAVPVALILGLGLYKEAYLKFLLVASPAFCLLAGRTTTAVLRRRRGVPLLLDAGIGLAVAVLLTGASLHGLGDYYTDPVYARDDYRAMAAYIKAVGRPGDAIVLDAPGQQEVFGYYYDGDLPVYPLPEQRPADPEATRQALEALARPGGRVFCLLWATDESDPERLVEGWLDAHAYKATDAWYGNVRLVIYAVPEEVPTQPEQERHVMLANQEEGDEIELVGYTLLSDGLAAGDIAQLTLFWRSEGQLQRRYKVFVHVLDANNSIVGQRDAEPGGGARVTTLWPAGEMVVDHYGVPIHPATPPGSYRIEVGLYDMETGRRMTTADGGADQVWLEPLIVERPPAPTPVPALGMEHDTTGKGRADFGPLALLGYDLHRLGFAHDPSAPLHPGDVLHVNLYWRAEEAMEDNWALSLELMGSDGEAAGLGAEPVPGYPTERWQAGDVWRGQFDLLLEGDMVPGRYRLWIEPVAPDGREMEPYVTPSVLVVQ
ncbi:MAG: glycosyltransferase family 39 protein [Anaerolineae bacterium]